MRSTVWACVFVMLAGAASADLFVVGSRASESNFPFYGC
jgi:hypothetical protein